MGYDIDDIDEVNEFIYLGSLIDTSATCIKEVKRRIAMARNQMVSFNNIWKSKICMRIKLRLLDAAVFSIASYGSESWTITRKLEAKIDAFEMWCYRRMLHVTWKEKRTNRWVLDKIGREMILKKNIIQRKMRYFGHACRNNGLERTVIQGMMEGKRGRGRPKQEWKDDIKRWTGMTSAPLIHLTANRVKWRRNMSTTAARYCAT